MKRYSLLILFITSALVLPTRDLLAGSTWNLITNQAQSKITLPSSTKKITRPTYQGIGQPILPPSQDSEDLLTKESNHRQFEGDQIRAARFDASVVAIPRENFFVRYGASLKLTDKDEMVVVKERTEDLSHLDLNVYTGLKQLGQKFRHTRYVQKHQGLEVLGTGYTLQEKDGKVISATGIVIPSLQVDMTPTITGQVAFQKALTKVGAQVYPWQQDPSAKMPEGKLAISSINYEMKEGSFHLVWRFVIPVAEPFDVWVAEVDAHDGTIVNFYSALLRENFPAKGVTYFNGEVPENPNDLTEFLVDRFEGTSPGTYQYRLRKPDDLPQYSTYRLLSQKGCHYEKEDIVDEGNDAYFKADSEKAGVSIHWGLGRMVKFIKDKFSWLGLDGIGAVPFEAYVADSSLFNKEELRAFYQGGCSPNPRLVFRSNKMTYFSKKYNKQFQANPFVSLDVVGHEFFHGMSDQARGAPIYASESSSIEEGMADVFSILFNQWMTGEDDDWCTEEEIAYWINCEDEMNPLENKLPDAYGGNYWEPYETCKEPDCTPHHNGALVTHWFYLLVKGGKGTNSLGDSYDLTGLNKEKAEQVLFRAVVNYFPPFTNFAIARIATLQAAIDFFGADSDEVKKVEKAWAAVGVGGVKEERHCSPYMGAYDVGPWPATFTCDQLPNEENVQVQVSEEPDFQGGHDTIDPSSAKNVSGKIRLNFAINLYPNTKYYWRIRGDVTKVTPTETGGTPGYKQSVPPWLGGSGGNSGQVGKSGNVTLGPLNIIGDPWAQAPVYFFTTAKQEPTLRGQKIEGWEVTHTWDKVPGAEQYFIRVSDSPSYQCPQPLNMPKTQNGVYDNFIPAPSGGSVSKKYTMKANKTYYWWVQAIGPGDIVGSCSYHGVGTAYQLPLPTVQLVSPVNYDKVVSDSITLKWKWVGGASGYKVEIVDAAGLAEAQTMFNSGKATTWEVPQAQTDVISITKASTFKKVGFLYWRVTPVGPTPDKQLGTPSEIRFMTTQLGKPTLVAPLGGSFQVYKEAVDFRWKVVAGATDYWITVYPKGSNTPVAGYPRLTGLNKDSSGNLYDAHDTKDVSTEKAGYEWTITATAGPGIKSDPSERGFYQIGPSFPVLNNPKDGSTGISHDTIQFSWGCEYAPNGMRFRVQKKLPGGGGYADIYDAFIGGTNGVGVYDRLVLEPGKEYAWTVTCLNAGINPDTSTWKDGSWLIAHFTTKEATPSEPPSQPEEPPPPPSSCETPPAPAAIGPMSYPAGAVQFVFVQSPGATKYKVQYKYFYINQWSSPAALEFSASQLFPAGTGPAYSETLVTPPVPLFNTGVYNWWVSAQNSCGKWSADSLTVGLEVK